MPFLLAWLDFTVQLPQLKFHARMGPSMPLQGKLLPLHVQAVPRADMASFQLKTLPRPVCPALLEASAVMESASLIAHLASTVPPAPWRPHLAPWVNFAPIHPLSKCALLEVGPTEPD